MQIKGKVAVVTPTQYSQVSIEDVETATPSHFSYLGLSAIQEDGKLDPGWAAHYTLWGTADIVIELKSVDEILNSAVDSLEAEKQKILAEAQVAVIDIESKIQKLLSIEYKA